MANKGEYWAFKELLVVGGSLRVAVMRNPVGDWDTKQGDRHLNIDIEPDEWEALFFDALDASWADRIEGEDGWAYLERQRKLFGQALSAKGYEMLGRIWEIYQDAAYLPSEVGKLREESLSVQKMTDDAAALEALRKILFACDEAQRIDSGIRMLSD